MANALKLSLALGAMLFVSQANAATVSIVDQDFFEGESGNSVDIAPYAPFLAAPDLVNESGVVNEGVTGNENSVRRSPWQWTRTGAIENEATGVYTSVQADSSGDLVFNTLMDTLQLAWGSPDSYNEIQFFNGVDFVAAITGAALQQSLLAPSIGVNFVTLYLGSDLFNTVKFLSHGANAFEFANVTAKGPNDAEPVVPLPAGLILLLSGLTGLGFLGRGRAKAA